MHFLTPVRNAATSSCHAGGVLPDAMPTAPANRPIAPPAPIAEAVPGARATSPLGGPQLESGTVPAPGPGPGPADGPADGPAMQPALPPGEITSEVGGPGGSGSAVNGERSAPDVTTGATVTAFATASAAVAAGCALLL